MMKRLTVAVGIALLLAGCTVKYPERTFQGAGILCSESGAEIQADPKLVEVAERALPVILMDSSVFGEMPKQTNGKTVDKDTIKDLLGYCTDFLSGKKSD